MSLVYCPECGKQISDKAEKCVHCGYPIKEYRRGSNIDKKIFRNTIFSKKKICIAGGIILLGVVLCLILFQSSPIKGKWYYVEDDDFWLEINNNTIVFRSVFTDEVYGTIKYKYNKSSKTISTGEIQATGVDGFSNKEMAEIGRELDGCKMLVKNSELHIQKNGVDIVFSSDKKYKRDH